MDYPTDRIVHNVFFIIPAEQDIRLLLAQWIIRSILHGGPIELFLVTASVPRLV